MVLLVIGASYVLVGFVITSVRAWRLGVHRAEAHQGRRSSGCEHFGCDMMAVEDLVPMFVLWPLWLPAAILAAWFRALIKGPYLRRLPPENGGPGTIVRSPKR